MPALIAPAIISAVGAAAGGITAGVITFAVSAVFYSALSFGLTAVFGKGSSGATGDLEGKMNMVRNPTAPRQIVYGENRISGPLVLVHTNGVSNEYLHMIVALAGHEIEDIGDVYFDDKVVWEDGASAPIAEFSGFLDLEKGYGADSQAWNATMGGYMGSYWDNTHRLRGIAYVYVRVKWDADLFPGGLPNVSAKIKGKLCYDPRTTLTAYSTNPALCLLDYLTDTRWGAGIPLTSFDLAGSWTTAANVCDEPVTLAAGGTEPRYTCNGSTDTSEPGPTVVGTLIDCMGGALFDVAGIYILHAGAYTLPSASFDETDLRGGIQVVSDIPRGDKYNGVKGTFASPLDEYQPVDFPSVQNAAYLALDGGEELWGDVQLPWTTSSSMCQRLAKIILLKNRQTLTASMPCMLTAMRAQIGDTITVSNTRMGWTDKVFEVVGFRFIATDEDGNPGVGVDLELRETASEVYDWLTTDEQALESSQNTNLPDPFEVDPPTGLTLTANQTTALPFGDGGWAGRILAEWTNPTNAFVQSGGRNEVQIRLWSGDDDDYESVALLDGSEGFAYIGGVKNGETYLVRVRAINVNGVRSAWNVSGAQSVVVDTTGPGPVTGVTSSSSNFWSETYHDRWLYWTNPTDLDFSKVEVRYKETGAGSWENTINTAGTSLLLRALDSAKDYTVEMTPYDRSGNPANFPLNYGWTGQTVVAAQGSPYTIAQPLELGDATNKYGHLRTYGMSDWDTPGDGIFIGYRPGSSVDPVFRVGDTAGSYMQWDPTSGLVISGKITGGEIDIGTGYDRLYAGPGEFSLGKGTDGYCEISTDSFSPYAQRMEFKQSGDVTLLFFSSDVSGSGRGSFTVYSHDGGTPGFVSMEPSNLYARIGLSTGTYQSGIYLDAANGILKIDAGRDFQADRFSGGTTWNSSYRWNVKAAASSKALLVQGENSYAIDALRNTYGATTGPNGVMNVSLLLAGTASDGFGPWIYFRHETGTVSNIYGGIGAVRDGAANTGKVEIKPASAGTIVNGLTVEVGRITTASDLVVGNDLSVLGGVISVSRNDTVNEGGQINLARADTGLTGWSIDVFNEGFRIFNDSGNTGSTATAIIQSASGVVIRGSYVQMGTSTVSMISNGHQLYRGVDDSLLQLFGGKKAGANIELYGPSHATAAHRCYIDANLTIFRTETASVNIAYFGSTGLNLYAGRVYKINGTQVVGARGASVSTVSETGDWSVDGLAVETAINAIISRLQAHGLIS